MVAERETVMNYKHQNICELIRSFADEQNGAEGGGVRTLLLGVRTV
jgi:hypothetical protein